MGAAISVPFFPSGQYTIQSLLAKFGFFFCVPIFRNKTVSELFLLDEPLSEARKQTSSSSPNEIPLRRAFPSNRERSRPRIQSQTRTGGDGGSLVSTKAEEEALTFRARNRRSKLVPPDFSRNRLGLLSWLGTSTLAKPPPQTALAMVRRMAGSDGGGTPRIYEQRTWPETESSGGHETASHRSPISHAFFLSFFRAVISVTENRSSHCPNEPQMSEF